MASYLGLVAVVFIVIFIGGALFGVCMIVAASVKAEDGATMRRDSRKLVLRDAPAGHLAGGVRRLVGVGQRISDEDPGDQ
jgi:hypothetical protein